MNIFLVPRLTRVVLDKGPLNGLLLVLSSLVPVEFEFDQLACLSTLILSHSGVQSIRPRSFQRFRALRQLLLAHNDIAALDSAMFAGLQHLELLDVSHNQLVFLPQSLFQQLYTLKVYIRTRPSDIIVELFEPRFVQLYYDEY